MRKIKCGAQQPAVPRGLCPRGRSAHPDGGSPRRAPPPLLQAGRGPVSHLVLALQKVPWESQSAGVTGWGRRETAAEGGSGPWALPGLERTPILRPARRAGSYHPCPRATRAPLGPDGAGREGSNPWPPPPNRGCGPRPSLGAPAPLLLRLSSNTPASWFPPLVPARWKNSLPQRHHPLALEAVRRDTEAGSRRGTVPRAPWTRLPLHFVDGRRLRFYFI